MKQKFALPIEGPATTPCAVKFLAFSRSLRLVHYRHNQFDSQAISAVRTVVSVTSMDRLVAGAPHRRPATVI
jgi:hypothetical protein